MTAKRFFRILAYSSFVASLFLPSRASEMTDQYGEHVKAWEPSVSIHLQIFFSPIIEWLDYRSFILISEVPDENWSDMWSHIFEWLSITITGWLFIAYPAVRRFSLLWKLAWPTSVVGTAFLARHLHEWATLYEPYFHLGVGGYLLLIAYSALSLYIFTDLMTTPRGSQIGSHE